LENSFLVAESMLKRGRNMDIADADNDDNWEYGSGEVLQLLDRHGCNFLSPYEDSALCLCSNLLLRAGETWG